MNLYNGAEGPQLKLQQKLQFEDLKLKCELYKVKISCLKIEILTFC